MRNDDTMDEEDDDDGGIMIDVTITTMMDAMTNTLIVVLHVWPFKIILACFWISQCMILYTNDGVIYNLLFQT